jgi:hypothetical protein
MKGTYALSPMQQGLLFHTVYSERPGMYVSQFSCTLHGDFDAAAFERAWQRIVDRHPIFRTAFVWEGVDEPVQVVSEHVTAVFERHDWRGVGADDRQRALDGFLEADRERGLALDRAPLMRLALMQLRDCAWQFVWTYHHLVIDGWSETLLFDELSRCYDAFRRGRDVDLPLPRPYGEYIAWLEQQDLAAAERTWRRALAGFLAPTRLSRMAGGSAAPAPDATFSSRTIDLSAATTGALAAITRRGHVTLNTVMQAAWGLLLMIESGDRDVVFGATVSGRPPELPGVERMIGPFINTLPVRIQASPETPLVAWLRMLQEQQAALRNYEYSPLVLVQQWSEIPRGTPLFETLLVFQSAPANTSPAEAEHESFSPRHIHTRDGWTNYPLSVDVRPGERLTMIITFDEQRFTDARVQRLHRRLTRILTEVGSAPDITVAALLARADDIDRRSGDLTGSQLEAANRQRLRRITGRSDRHEPTQGVRTR